MSGEAVNANMVTAWKSLKTLKKIKEEWVYGSTDFRYLDEMGLFRKWIPDKNLHKNRREGYAWL